MSSEFTVPPRIWLCETNDYTDKINKVFNQHWKTLNDERQATIDEINKWRRDSEERINKYADEQTALINNHYNHLRPIFDEKHKENLETANACHARQQITLFNELHEACQLLRFRVATLKFSKHEMDEPEVAIVERQLKIKNLEEMNINTRDAARRRRRRDKGNGNNTENISVGSGTSPTDSITSNPKQADDQQSSENKSKRNNQSKGNTDDTKNQVMNNDESNNKCPICYMIFPLSMTGTDREKHVNEHYTDD